MLLSSTPYAGVVTVARESCDSLAGTVGCATPFESVALVPAPVGDGCSGCVMDANRRGVIGC
ncbi:MAG: hypothetical protein KDD58_16430, partial [Bdellovibrionales bacterium]|nr:hypothetical protein [Bdellovibrionales bacterium]